MAVHDTGWFLEQSVGNTHRSGLWSVVIMLSGSTIRWLSGSSFLEKEEWSEVESVSFLPMSLVVQSFALLAPPVMPGTTRGMVWGYERCGWGEV